MIIDDILRFWFSLIGFALFLFVKDVDVSICASGRGQLIVGDNEGFLHMINRQLQVNAFKAYEIRVSHLFQMKQHSLLISVGVSK